MHIDRRKFIKTTATAASVAGLFTSSVAAAHQKDIAPKNIGALQNMPVGVINWGDIKSVKDLGFSTCQISPGSFDPELAEEISEKLIKYEMRPSSLICNGPGNYIWDFVDGPATIGLVPREGRKARVERLKEGVDFCKIAGIPAVHAHFGFIPENPKDTLYIEFIETMKGLGEYGLKRGVNFYFETGQETPVTLLRAIEDIGTGNMFVNYDTANMAMYGKANPLDGLKVLSKYVKALHAKDGMYPTDPNVLGKEMPIPQGIVDFPGVIEHLKEIDFKGEIIIECEMSGDNTDHIQATKRYLENLIES